MGHHRWSAYHRTHQDSDHAEHRDRAPPGDRSSHRAPGNHYTAYAGQRDHAAQYGDAAVDDAQDWNGRAPKHVDQVHDSDRATVGSSALDHAFDTEQFPVDLTGAPFDTDHVPFAVAGATNDTVAAVHANDESTFTGAVAAVHANDESTVTDAVAAIHANDAGPSTSTDSCAGAHSDEIERKAEGLGGSLDRSIVLPT